MQTSVVNLSQSQVEKSLENDSIESGKVYYKYVSDSVEENMPPVEVGQMLVELRGRFDAELARDPGFSAAALKSDLRAASKSIDKFASEHPRMFDMVMSKFSSEKDIEMMMQMVRFREAINRGLIPESQARAAMNEILLDHNKRPVGTDREKMADERIERKVSEGSYLGFDASSIPELKRAAAEMATRQ